jgi:DNA-binding winged helix-turn-helix (wHTH) protein/TolB-like protein/Flp pilus assembly protein TadD
MSQQPKRFYEFGAYRLDARDHLLLREGEVVPLAPKALDLLLVLVEKSGRVLSKEELMKLVWPESFVEEANLSHHVFTLRKALGEDNNGGVFIETIPRRGYRFVARVAEVQDESDELVVAEHSRSRIVIEQTEAPNLAPDYRGSDRTGRVPTLAAGTRRRTVLLALACAGALVLAIAVYFWKTGNTAGEPIATGVKSIAVLPFKPLVADSRNESLEIGMADTLITKLSGITQLIVRPLSAIRKYTSLEQDSIAAGRELGVDYVLEGNLQMEGEKVRASVRLLSVKDGQAIWTDKFDEKSSGSIFSIQDSISQQVARALVPKLTGEEQRQLAKRYTDNTEAYNLYLTGRFFWSRFNEEGLKKAIEYFNQAIAIDPNYALAYTGLAGVYNVQGALGIIPSAETWSKAKWAAEKAVELDDKLAKAHQVLGAVKLMYEWDWSGAERELARSIELNPADGEPHNLYAYYYEAKGQLDKGLSEMRRAQELAPLSAVINADVASGLYYQGNYEEAINAWRKAEEMDPHFGPSPLFLPAQIYEQKGEYDQAIAECQKAFSVFGRDPGILAVLGYTYAVSSKRREAQNILAEIESLWKRRYFSPIDVALVYTGLGDKDGAFAWLTKAYEARDPQLIWLKVEPELKSLHTDPRFGDLLRRMGLESSVN